MFLKTNKLIKNSLIYVIGDFIGVAVTGFILLPLITSLLTEFQYGIYSTVNASIVLITYIVQFGLISTYSRFYFNSHSESDKKELGGNILIIHIIIAFFVFLLHSVLKSFLFPIFTGGRNQWYYLYTLMIPILGFLKNLYAIHLRIKEQAIKFAIYQVSSVLTFVLIFLVSTKVFKDKLDAIFIANIITSVIFWLLAFIKLKFNFNIKSMKQTITQVLKFSCPIVAGYLLYYLMTKFNVLFLQKYESIENIGVFSFGFQLSTVFTIFAGAFAKAVQPIIYKTDPLNVNDKIKKLSLLYKITITILLVIMISFSKLIINFLGSGKFIKSLPIFVCLTINTFFYNFRLVEGFSLLYYHKPNYSFLMTLVGAITVLTASVVLVPRMGYLGSAFSITLGSIMVYITNKIITTKLLRGGVNVKKVK